MKYNPEKIGELIRNTRKAMGIRQSDLALTSGTGMRFIIDLEKGKATCQLGKVLTVLYTLGIKIDFKTPLDRKIENAASASNISGSGSGAGIGSGAGNSDGYGGDLGYNSDKEKKW